MTENNWPQDGTYGTPTAQQTDFQQADLRPASTFPPVPNGGANGTSAGAPAKSEVAQNEAAEVTHQAAESAQNVAGTAKAEVANVASEVKTNARDLLQQAKYDLTEQAGAQQQKVAEGLRSVSTELQSMAAASEQPGVATDLVRQAAERSSAVASWLDGRDPGSLLTEVKSFARQRPGTFLLLAAGAGVLAGRLSRSLSAGAPEPTHPVAGGTTPATRAPDTGIAVPPPPVQLPAPEAATAGFADTYPPNPLESDPGNGSRQDRRGSEPVVADPLGTDPLRDDSFDGGRR
jgi:hypothetical protein